MKERRCSHVNEPVTRMSKYEYVCLRMFKRQLADNLDPTVAQVKDALEAAMALTEQFFEATEGARRAFMTEDALDGEEEDRVE